MNDFNRMRYDPCEYSADLKMSTSPIQYILNPIRYENCHKCRPESGLVASQDVSLDNKNLVDLESDLSGRTHPVSRSACGLYQPTCKGAHRHQCTKTSSGIPYDCDECQPKKFHLRPCQMVQQRPRATDVGYRIENPSCEDIRKDLQRSLPKTSPGDFTRMGAVKPYIPTNFQSNTGYATYN